MRKMPNQKYTVKVGDNLWNISQRIYGDGEHWESIYAENVHLIGSNPDYLIEGLVLRISGRPLNYIEIVKNMIEYYEEVVYQAQENSEEPPRESGLLFKYQDIMIRIRVGQGLTIIMLLLILLIVLLVIFG